MENAGEIRENWALGTKMAPELTPELTPPLPATQLPYSGSVALAFLVPYIRLDIDKINFVICSLVSLCLAYFYAKCLPPSTSTAKLRHYSSLIIGISLISFCFGWQTIHLLLQTYGSFLIMKFMAQDQQQLYTLAFTLAYTTLIHLHRMTYNYECTYIDISGPMMICTQKLTYLSFSLRDGAVLTKEKKEAATSSSSTASALTPEQRRLSVLTLPSLLEVMSFVLYFPTVLAGPLYSYVEFRDYIDGADIRQSFGADKGGAIVPATPWGTIAFKVAQAFVSAGLVVAWQDHFPFSVLIASEFVSFSFFGKIAVSIMCTYVHRCRFYFAFLMAEAGCNTAGFGWRIDGDDDAAETKIRWDNVTNIDIFKIETATSLKLVTDSWNRQTGVWLRRICYERTKSQRLLKTWMLSAFWHGVYPGYFVAFLQMSILVQVARRLRRLCRPFFLESVWRKTFYDFVTWLTTVVYMSYGMVPFALLEINRTIYYYNCFGWLLHILVAFVILFFAVTTPLAADRKTKENENNNIEDKHRKKD